MTVDRVAFAAWIDAIARAWERERDGAAEVFTMAAEIVAVDGNTGVARVSVRYGEPEPKEFLDLWLVRFDPAPACSIAARRSTSRRDGTHPRHVVQRDALWDARTVGNGSRPRNGSPIAIVTSHRRRAAAVMVVS